MTTTSFQTQDLPVLDTLDPELLERVVDRRGAIGNITAATAALAVASVPLGLGVLAKRAFAQGGPLPQGIRDVLNFALTLEYLEAEFYQLGLAAPGLIPVGTGPVFVQISNHEDAHVALLQSALGANAVAKPTFDFTAGGALADVFSNYATFLALAQGFEDAGVRAYKGQAGALITDNAILTTALQIHSVEARHASKVRRLRAQKGWITGSAVDVLALVGVYVGEETVTQAAVNTTGFAGVNAATEAFDEPLTMAQVLAIAGPFIV